MAKILAGRALINQRPHYQKLYLGIDWRMGAEWFETCLLDYDPCSNYGNWTYGADFGNEEKLEPNEHQVIPLFHVYLVPTSGHQFRSSCKYSQLINQSTCNTKNNESKPTLGQHASGIDPKNLGSVPDPCVSNFNPFSYHISTPNTTTRPTPHHHPKRVLERESE
ncbi:hypothetical protein LguiA_033603 [Lonicera macranthoides]